MTTEALRREVRTVAQQLSGKVWPNGLGFDARGWEYMLHDSGEWSASRRETAHHKAAYGRASSPIRAKVNALNFHLRFP